MTKHIMKKTLLAVVTGAAIAGMATSANAQHRWYGQGYLSEGPVIENWEAETPPMVAEPRGYGYGYSAPSVHNACAIDAINNPNFQDYTRC